MINGLNHLTLAVTDLSASIEFYRDVLGFDVTHAWPDGAYLEGGTLWLCLSLCDSVNRRSDYTHIAFDVGAKDFSDMAKKLRNYQIDFWQENVSEGDSVYFLDPDGHKLEIHSGSLESRMRSIRDQMTVSK